MKNSVKYIRQHLMKSKSPCHTLPQLPTSHPLRSPLAMVHTNIHTNTHAHRVGKVGLQWFVWEVIREEYKNKLCFAHLNCKPTSAHRIHIHTQTHTYTWNTYTCTYIQMAVCHQSTLHMVFIT